MLLIDIGCGSKKSTVNKQVYKKVVGVDLPENVVIKGADFSKEADYQVDLEKGKLPFKNNSIDIFYSSHTFEHFNDIEHLMQEIYRCIKPNGLLVVRVPHYSWPNANNPFHKLYYCYNNSFSHYIPEVQAKKGTEHYTHVKFNYVKRKLRFGRYSQFIVQPIVNLFPLFYERYLSAVYPC